MTAEIDFCTPQDAHRLHEIETASFDHPWMKHMIEYGLDEQGAAVFMKASLKEIAVGYAVIARDEGFARLINLAVLPEYRRMAIASQLLIAVETMSQEWGYKKMSLEVRPSNQAARDLYAKVGFEFTARRRAYYSNGEDALVLTARLPLNIK